MQPVSIFEWCSFQDDGLFSNTVRESASDPISFEATYPKSIQAQVLQPQVPLVKLFRVDLNMLCISVTVNGRRASCKRNREQQVEVPSMNKRLTTRDVACSVFLQRQRFFG